jgi:hypothetical protein
LHTVTDPVLRQRFCRLESKARANSKHPLDAQLSYWRYLYSEWQARSQSERNEKVFELSCTSEFQKPYTTHETKRLSCYMVHNPSETNSCSAGQTRSPGSPRNLKLTRVQISQPVSSLSDTTHPFTMDLLSAYISFRFQTKNTEVQGGSNMTGTNCHLFTHKSSRSYLNHLVLLVSFMRARWSIHSIPFMSSSY